MSDQTWKAVERRIARRLRMKRTPLSGRGGGAGTSGDAYEDSPHPRASLYVEVKHYARMAIFSLWRDTEEKAAREKRTTVVVLHEKGTQRYLAVVDLATLCYFLDLADDNGTTSLWRANATVLD